MADDDASEHVLMRLAADEADIGVDLFCYCSGDELLRCLRLIEDPVELPEIIILDLRMAGLGGYGTLDELQADPDLWEIPVMVFTSSTRPVEKSLSYERGARLFQTKPSEFEQLVSLVNALPLLTLTPGPDTPDPRRSIRSDHLFGGAPALGFGADGGDSDDGGPVHPDVLVRANRRDQLPDSGTDARPGRPWFGWNAE